MTRHSDTELIELDDASTAQVGGGRIILMPSYIYQQSMGVQDWPFAAALSLIFTAAVIGIVAAIGALSRRLTRGLDAA